MPVKLVLKCATVSAMVASQWKGSKINVGLVLFTPYAADKNLTEDRYHIFTVPTTVLFLCSCAFCRSGGYRQVCMKWLLVPIL